MWPSFFSPRTPSSLLPTQHRSNRLVWTPSIDGGWSVLHASPALKTWKWLYVLRRFSDGFGCKQKKQTRPWFAIQMPPWLFGNKCLSTKHCETLKKKEAMKRVACMEERIGWFSAADFIFSQRQPDLFMVLHETIRFCFAFQSMWMSFGMCWFCVFCMFWPQWSWMAAIILCGCSRLIEDQSFHVNRTIRSIRNTASISLPVPPCSAAATPEPVLIELHHLGVTHGCHLQKISPGRVHLWFFNVVYVYSVYYT